MAFTPRERARIKHFLGYPDWVSLAQSLQLGFPAGAQPLFLLESAFNRMTEDAEESIRMDLCECEDIEKQLRDARKRLKAQRLGDLVMNPNELRVLKRELMFWITRLADDLGVVSNPYSQAMYRGIGSAGGVGAKVVG